MVGKCRHRRQLIHGTVRLANLHTTHNTRSGRVVVARQESIVGERQAHEYLNHLE